MRMDIPGCRSDPLFYTDEKIKIFAVYTFIYRENLLRTF